VSPGKHVSSPRCAGRHGGVLLLPEKQQTNQKFTQISRKYVYLMGDWTPDDPTYKYAYCCL